MALRHVSYASLLVLSLLMHNWMFPQYSEHQHLTGPENLKCSYGYLEIMQAALERMVVKDLMHAMIHDIFDSNKQKLTVFFPLCNFTTYLGN